MCRIHTKSWIFISEKIISHDFCTSFVLHKVKEAFGGSRWKLVELTHVSRYLAYDRGGGCQYKSHYKRSSGKRLQMMAVLTFLVPQLYMLW